MRLVLRSLAFLLCLVVCVSLVDAQGIVLESGLAAGGPSSAADDEVKTKKLVVHPAFEPRPALKYRLLPILRDMKPGNAALLYQRAHSPEWFGAIRRLPEFDKMPDLLEAPLAKMSRDKANTLLLVHMLNEIDLAARREHCDWEFTDRIRTDGIGLLIPDVQGFRYYGQLLSLRTRVRLLDRDFDKAVHSMQTSFALGRHVSEAPILINALVGLAIMNMAANDLEELVQLPGSPNLYWSLAALPRPMVDLRKVMEGERIMIDAVFPGIRDALNDPRKPAMSVEHMATLTDGLGWLGLAGRDSHKAGMAFLASRVYPKARQLLIDRGRTAEQVDAMPVVQVGLMYAMAEYERHFDDMLKWHCLPPWKAREGMKKSREEFHRAIVEEMESSWLARLLLPATERVFESEFRFERRLALLQTVEAVRLYAAEHGKLPGSLGEMKMTPAPEDPLTGEPFQYTLLKGKALLVAPPPPGVESNPRTTQRYEISLAPKSK